MECPDGVTIRDVTVADADDLGLISVSGSFSTFLWVVPEPETGDHGHVADSKLREHDA